ncbi:MAG: hypothetical protein ACC650_02160 [Gammaproteobacteria bacterium]
MSQDSNSTEVALAFDIINALLLTETHDASSDRNSSDRNTAGIKYLVLKNIKIFLFKKIGG